MKKINVLIAIGIGLSLVTTSCTKENEPVVKPTDTSSVAASATIDLINELDIQTGNKLSKDYSTVAKMTASSTTCPTITLDPVTTSFPKTYYVDYGTGCTTNSITKKGKLKITFTNSIIVTGSKMTIERVGYYVNGNKVEGTLVYENTTTNPNIPQWTRTVTNGKLTTTTGDVFLNSGSHKVKQTAGVASLTLDDNTYEMYEGTHTVSKENGIVLKLTVNKSLIKNYSCDYISKGEIKVESTLLNGTIDYGNGDCDNKGTYSQGGFTFPFEM